jgi:FixJ family two-component response regulator
MSSLSGLKVPDVNTPVPTIHIVDDDASVRTAVGRVLRTAGYEVNVYESAGDFLERVPTNRGCILVDVLMPGLSGPQLQDVLNKMGVALPVIFLTGHGDIPTSVHAIKAGAEDFLSKPAPKRVLLEAIERALKRYDELHEHNVRLEKFRACFNALTPREHEVFVLVVHGKLNKQIAHELGTSERTVKAHRHGIMNKFSTKSLAELVSIAGHLGMVAESASR